MKNFYLLAIWSFYAAILSAADARNPISFADTHLFLLTSDKMEANGSDEMDAKIFYGLKNFNDVYGYPTEIARNQTINKVLARVKNWRVQKENAVHDEDRQAANKKFHFNRHVLRALTKITYLSFKDTLSASVLPKLLSHKAGLYITEMDQLREISHFNEFYGPLLNDEKLFILRGLFEKLTRLKVKALASEGKDVEANYHRFRHFLRLFQWVRFITCVDDSRMAEFSSDSLLISLVLDDSPLYLKKYHRLDQLIHFYDNYGYVSEEAKKFCEIAIEAQAREGEQGLRKLLHWVKQVPVDNKSVSVDKDFILLLENKLTTCTSTDFVDDFLNARGEPSKFAIDHAMFSTKRYVDYAMSMINKKGIGGDVEHWRKQYAQAKSLWNYLSTIKQKNLRDITNIVSTRPMKSETSPRKTPVVRPETFIVVATDVEDKNPQ